MTTGENEFQNWDDLVFENRNKSYGAYAIRKAYDKRLIEGLVASSVIGIFAFFLPGILSSTDHAPKIIASDPTSGVIVDFLNPLVKKEPPQKKADPPAKRLNPNLIPKLTAIETDRVDFPDPNIDISSTGVLTGTPDIGATTGTLTGKDDTPIVSVKETGILDHAEVMPMYDGGMQAMIKFIQKKLRYPNGARVIGTEGTVFVQFVINAEGKVVDIHVIRGISDDCDKEAVRVLGLMPAWHPGSQNHIPVSVRMVLPFKFKLNE
jgi:periplasmic protein TonB